LLLNGDENRHDLGGEHSEHSADGTLQGFFLYLANQFPQSYGNNLTRLLPLEVNARHQIVQKQVYKSSEEIIAGMHARGMSQKLIDAIVAGTNSWKPTPIDYSKPRSAETSERRGGDDGGATLEDHGGATSQR
jgi:hypothetical protein